MKPLDRLCRHHGITTHYPRKSGGFGPVPEDSLRLILGSLGLATAEAPDRPRRGARLRPPRGVTCHLPAWLLRAPAWGLTCQLYELRSERNWGIGDLRDLRDLAAVAARAGADFLGVNPLHALFGADPTRISPFSPSNRLFLNPLYIAADEVPGAPAPPRPALDAVRAAEAVDYAAVGRLKLAALREAFDRQPFGALTREAHDAFRESGGTPLRRHALFEALSAAMVAQGHGAGWTTWPEPLRDAGGEAVARFAEEHAAEVDFQIWLQWIASLQLAQAREAARGAGLRIGLYLDLAVGEAPDGSATWSDPDLTLARLSLGAPPDVFAVEGQSWGLAAPSPRALAERGFAPFREMIAAQLRHAGALRIDHAMALWQLFLVPEGQSARVGAHLRYPFAEMVRVLAEESRASEAVVVGEDLGFVPPGFREAMEALRILSYRIVYFEQRDGAFLRPRDYPALALACLSTHDLPTLAGWWRAEDVALRDRHGLVDAARSAEASATRDAERTALLRALAEENLLPEGCEPDPAGLPESVLVAAHRFIARTPSALAGVRLADLVGPVEPTNLPGTVHEYPNWRLRSPTSLEDIPQHPAFRAVTAAMASERPRR